MSIRVETTYGVLEGTEADGVAVFKGIPFAAAPVGERRWAPPEPPEPWEGVLPADEFGPSCPQLSMSGGPFALFSVDGPQDEDCLYLNVWTPHTDDERRPVLFWIHGGGFNSGSASNPLYDGRHLARRGDVVVVTTSYRVGPFGFLNLDRVTGGAIPSTGNEGLLDQVAALKWVRDNIAAFGGDPGNVTVFGESAGGWSAAALMAMPSAKGLFHKAIAQSGVAHPGLEIEYANELAQEFIDHVDVSSRDAEGLRSLSADDLIAAAPNALRNATADPGSGDRFLRHVVDGQVLPRQIVEEVADGSSRDVPVIIGTTRDEITNLFVIDGYAGPESPLVKTRRFLPPGVDPVELLPVYREARRARSARDTEADLAGAIATDSVRVPSTRFLDAHRRHQPATYSYMFTWTRPTGDGGHGASHGSEIGYVFGTYDLDDEHAAAWGAGPAARALSEAMMDAWGAFARTGDPSTAALGSWPAYGDARRTMMLGERIHVLDAPLEEERRAWDRYSNADLARPGFGSLVEEEDAHVGDH
ncbi:putative carboxylesterase [Nocardia nova SH22a]|uniref:Carboxylic ester hydrolase n=1 Tax=Nocardia nova SH22a TaxID=1415166 RepID=W5TRF4_9NOCA|nr:carboxylesterase/lipase family protein [Nocardia nova]AHH19826.1 putative carboxylesterase [Nocardia nova SH22a]